MSANDFSLKSTKRPGSPKASPNILRASSKSFIASGTRSFAWPLNNDLNLSIFMSRDVLASLKARSSLSLNLSKSSLSLPENFGHSTSIGLSTSREWRDLALSSSRNALMNESTNSSNSSNFVSSSSLSVFKDSSSVQASLLPSSESISVWSDLMILSARLMYFLYCLEIWSFLFFQSVTSLIATRIWESSFSSILSTSSKWSLISSSRESISVIISWYSSSALAILSEIDCSSFILRIDIWLSKLAVDKLAAVGGGKEARTKDWFFSISCFRLVLILSLVLFNFIFHSWMTATSVGKFSSSSSTPVDKETKSFFTLSRWGGRRLAAASVRSSGVNSKSSAFIAPWTFLSAEIWLLNSSAAILLLGSLSSVIWHNSLIRSASTSTDDSLSVGTSWIWLGWLIQPNLEFQNVGCSE